MSTPSRSETGLVLHWWIWLVGIGLLMSCILSVGVFGFGWFQTGADIVGSDNVKSQWQFAYDGIENLKAGALLVCTAEKAVDAAQDSNERSQRVTQLIAMENNYNRQAADYNGRMNDPFRAKLVKPADVPAQAPTLAEMKALVCP